MRIRLVWLAGLALLLAVGPAPAAGPPRSTPSDVQALAEKIDALLAQRWDSAGATPAPRADDAEFLRRVYLDLSGRIPTVAEARSFLADKRADKRTRLVAEILDNPRHVTHSVNIWRSILIPEAGNNFQVRLQQPSFESWLKQQVARRVGYDQLARDLLTAKVGQGGGIPFADLGTSSPLTFYLAKEFKPENLAAGTARVFLGISVECAQCHDHPFADWKREQFWGFAAFFAGVNSQRLQDFLLPAREDPDKHELSIPGTTRVAQAKFLDGTEPKWKPGVSARTTLADWVTSPANPYFSRAAVNRTWAYFFGTALFDPMDDTPAATNQATHPELLALLTKEFVAHDFDLAYLIKAITSSRAYQLSSAVTHKSQGEPSLFARMPLRGLTAEQIFDSVSTATGFRDSGGGDDLISGIVGGNRSARSEFLTRFAPSEKPTESQTSILHALTLMNGKVIADATSLEKSETLSAVIDAPFASTAERIEVLYLATLARKPEAKEIDRATKFIANAGKGKKTQKGEIAAYNNALADLFWALLNSPEFILNH